MTEKNAQCLVHDQWQSTGKIALIFLNYSSFHGA